MTKAQLIAVVAAETYSTKKDAEKLLELAFTRIGEAVSKGGRFAWPSFGVFTLRSRKSRRVRNPATGELMPLPKMLSVGFRASKALRRSVKR